MSNANYKQRLKDILTKFNVSPKSIGVKFEDEVKLEIEAALQDGTKIYSTAGSWEVGVDAFMKDEEDNATPCAPGDYVLEDGTILSIGDDAMVSAITPPKEEMSSEDIFKVLETMSERIAALESKNTELSAELANKKQIESEAEAKIGKLETELSALKKLPATTSVKDKTVVKLSSTAAPQKSFGQMTILERIKFNLENK
jgi:uncharacterized small protein (DUF1192 family)